MALEGRAVLLAVGVVPCGREMKPALGPLMDTTPALPAVPDPPVPAVPTFRVMVPPFELAPVPADAPPFPAVRVMPPPVPPTVLVPVPAPPLPAVIEGAPPTPAVPVAFESPPPTGAVTTRIELAFVPDAPDEEAGAVPLRVIPTVEVEGCVNVASAVGFERPFALLSNGGLQLVIEVAPEKHAMLGEAGEPVVVTVPPPPLALNGPTVEPAIWANIPEEVVHTSPLFGLVGATP